MTSSYSAREDIDRILVNERSRLHTLFPAQVLAYDAAAQTVDVRPALQREVLSDDPAVPWAFEELPDLLSTQIMWPRAGGFVITFPIQPGDWVMVACAEQATQLWRKQGGTNVAPPYVDPHGLNGCVAIPGWAPDAAKLANVSTTDLVIGRLDDDATVRIKPDGTVVTGGEAGAQYVALANLVRNELQTLKDALRDAKPAPGAADGGAGFQTSLGTLLANWPRSVAAGKTKAR